MSRSTLIHQILTVAALFLLTTSSLSAQNTRPRRASKQTQKSTASAEKPASDPLLRPEPVQSQTSRKTSPNDPLLTVQPVNPVGNPVENPVASPVSNTVAPADTHHAYSLLEQKQFAAAAKEAKDLAAQHPND